MRFVLHDCSDGCSLGQRKSPIFQLIHSWFEAGDNNDTIVAKAKDLDYKISAGAVGRHRRVHLSPVHEPVGPAVEARRRGVRPAEEKSKVDHLAFLEKVIAKSAQGLEAGGFKISPDMGIKAMELIYKLTQGNAQQNWMDEMNAAIQGITVPNDGSVESPDEAAQAEVSG